MWMGLVSAIVVFLLVSVVAGNFHITTQALGAFLKGRIQLKRSTKKGARRGILDPRIVTDKDVVSGGGGVSSSVKEFVLRAPQEFLEAWEDLAPPFRMPDEDALEVNTIDLSSFDEDEKNEEKVDRSMSPVPELEQVTHFCFLVHGHRGFSRDLAYMETVMKHEAKREQQQRRSPTAASSRSENNHADAQQQVGPQQQPFGIVVHSAVCNEHKTVDGVVNGGERLTEELIECIRKEMSQRRSLKRQRQQRQNSQNNDHDDNPAETKDLLDVTISVLGNSLGGLYSRYAIAKLTERCQYIQEEGARVLVLDGLYRIHFNIFCTTATPHLGVASHTFLPIPRTAEIGVAMAMGETGRDLFRLNDILKTMATSPDFLEPLGRFRKRIAYANAYGTDFPVPVHTAAFLSESSRYPHLFLHEEDGDRMIMDDRGCVIATLETPPSRRDSSSQQPLESNMDANSHDQEKTNGEDADAADVLVDHEDELAIMSSSLDALGWKKVFLDVRKDVPKIPIPLPKSLIRRISQSSNDSDTEGSMSSSSRTSFSFRQRRQQKGSIQTNADWIEEETRASQSEALRRLKQRGVATSRDVAAAVSFSPAQLFDETFYWPSGHNMIIAFSRTRLSTYRNKAGRPVVDALARDLMQDILAWKQPEKKSVGAQQRRRKYQQSEQSSSQE